MGPISTSDNMAFEASLLEDDLCAKKIMTSFKMRRCPRGMKCKKLKQGINSCPFFHHAGLSMRYMQEYNALTIGAKRLSLNLAVSPIILLKCPIIRLYIAPLCVGSLMTVSMPTADSLTARRSSVYTYGTSHLSNNTSVNLLTTFKRSTPTLPPLLPTVVMLQP
eukprot:Rmarinus@m.21820